MKKLVLTLLFFGVVILKLNAQCGPTDVFADQDTVAICQGDTAVINFSANGTCTGNYEYQILDGAVVVQGWSTSTVFSASPAVSTIYTVEVRCDACPTTVISGIFNVFVTENPVVTGDTLICYGTSTMLVASSNAQYVDWWDAQSGGTQLSTSDTLNTQALTSSQTFWVHLSNTIGTGGGSILITECGLAGFVVGQDNDYIEISNLFNTTINTTGWKVAISNSYTNINAVNSIIWDLPSSFAPCSILSKTDNSGAANYWGVNILWNPSQKGWAIILDNSGNVMDFVGWGWTAAELAGFNPTIAGYSVTLGTEWVGASVPSACGSTSAPESITRIGSNDNNDAGDFICQPTSLNTLNPGLNCGWAASTACTYPVNVIVDQPPTASNPDTINVECTGDVPAPDVNVVTDEADDFTTSPVVTYLSDVSDGLSCPETITRTYRVTDSCSNYLDVIQTIIIHDVTAPVLDVAPADVTVECNGDVPAMTDLSWTDNCDGTGTVTGVDTSDGNSCPETITRTWMYTDSCGNVATATQIIIIDDTTPPTANNLPNQQVAVLPAADPSLVNDAADNCTANPVVVWVNDVSDGGLCPETVVRTYSVTDDCGNEIFITQEFAVGDPYPNAQFIAEPQIVTTTNPQVVFTNTTTGAVSYDWDFGDGSQVSNEVNPTHLFPGEGYGEYVVMLIAYNSSGCSDTFSLVIIVQQTHSIVMPNVFTPNGDNMNDFYLPVSYESIEDPELVIVNRWGSVMFSTNDLDVGWNGKVHGAPAVEGVYYWKLDFNSLGEAYSMHGFFHLTR